MTVMEVSRGDVVILMERDLSFDIMRIMHVSLNVCEFLTKKMLCTVWLQAVGMKYGFICSV